MDQHKPLSREHEIGVALGIVLSVFTCGIYNIYWNYKQFQAMNTLLGRQEYNFVFWLLLSLITCGLFHIYYEYKMGSDLEDYLKKHGYNVNPNLSIIGLVLSCLALTILADAIYQHEINRLAAESL
ncbi:MAG: DUF4234 domain-containing protein [Elusimicrobia bacterium]|nr:DUF4234 domain-containing protein [Elusimicrobiota bacterium]